MQTRNQRERSSRKMLVNIRKSVFVGTNTRKVWSKSIKTSDVGNILIDTWFIKIIINSVFVHRCCLTWLFLLSCDFIVYSSSLIFLSLSIYVLFLNTVSYHLFPQNITSHIYSDLTCCPLTHPMAAFSCCYTM